MGNLGAPEILLIVLVIVLLFGAKKLPDLARSVGRSMRIFKSEVKEMTNEDEAQNVQPQPQLPQANYQQQGYVQPQQPQQPQAQQPQTQYPQQAQYPQQGYAQPQQNPPQQQ